MSSNLSNTSGIGIKDKIGYALGDVGSLLVFGLVNTFLQVFYTDKLGITPLVVMLIMIIARVWDAINDPIWGRIVDSAPSKPRRRYKKWLLYLCLPLAFSSILMFIDVNGWFHFSNVACVIYAIVSYIAFGMLYTGTNIPYGSMSSVVTSDDKERSALSIFRSVGSTLGGFGPMVVNFFVWETVDGVQVLNSTKLIIGVAIMAVLSVVCSILCYKFSEERVVVPARNKEDRPKGETIRVLKNLLKTRSFVIISVVGMLFLAAQMFQTTYNMYVFKVFFNNGGLATLSTVCQYLPVAIIMFFSGKLVRKFGRKEVCAFGLLFTALCFGILAVIPIGMARNVLMWIFLAVSLLAGFGNAFIFLMIWALANDAIDDYFVKTKSHDEATAYSIFTFMRKLGQTVAAIVVNISLISLGYGATGEKGWTTANEALDKGVDVSMMYYQSIIIPAALSLLMFLLLMFVYPLSKKRVESLQEEKASVLEQKEVQE